MTDAPQQTTVRLTPTQQSLLRRIVATNGGGISTYKLEGSERRVVMRLCSMGMVQGKAGQEWVAVHTRPGLEWVRANPEEKAA